MSEDQDIKDLQRGLKKLKKAISNDPEMLQNFNSFKKIFESFESDESDDKDGFFLLLFANHTMVNHIVDILNPIGEDMEDLKSRIAFLEKDFTPMKRRLKRLNNGT